jgi:hypothetical protein
VIVSGMLTDLIRVGGPVIRQVIKRGRIAHSAKLGSDHAER